MGTNYNLKKYYRATDFLESMAGHNYRHKIRQEKKIKIFREFMTMLGNPEKDFKIIHLTGTSGKGTVSSLIHAGLTKAGYKVGLYLSPHTTSVIERIKLNDRYIAAEAFYHILSKIRPMINGIQIPPDYLSLLMAIAFVYFSEEKCDYVVLEAGAGGKYDSSIVIPPPIASIITNVEHDHTDYLGKTLMEIAGHKSAIIKKDTPYFFTAVKDKKVLKYLKEICNKKKVEFNHIKPNGEYFKDTNVKLAQNVLDKLNIKVKLTENIVNKAAKLPCRQEIVQTKPTIMLDGAHNPSKMSAFVSSLDKMKKKAKYIIIGISYNKDWRNILKIIEPYGDEIILTRMVTSKHPSVSPLHMKNFIKKHFPDKKVKLFWGSLDALDYVLENAKKNDFVIITGSMYLSGELRRYWIPEDHILKYRRSF